MANNIFKNLIESYLDDRKKHIEHTAFYIENGFYPSWNKEYHNNPDRGLKEHSTETRWNQYKNGIITREKAVEFATARMKKAVNKEAAAKIEKLEEIAGAPDFEAGSIYIDWVRSSTWGYNPHCEFYTGTTKYFGSASGCGYDKESAAVAQALNDCPEILKALYLLKEAALVSGVGANIGNNEAIGYGSGYSIIPYFEGGVGVSCFWRILEKAGIKVTTHYNKHGNTYILIKV